MDDAASNRFPGPRRPEGAPVGPEAVRRAVLDAAADRFARQGIGATTRRELADAAGVHPNLINRYVGDRSSLVQAVLDDLAVQVAADLRAAGTGALSYDPDTAAWRWTRIMVQAVITEHLSVEVDPEAWNPVKAIADVLVEALGADPRSARIRAAHVVAAALGWRLLEPYLVIAGGLEDEPIELLRAELNRVHQMIGALPVEDVG